MREEEKETGEHKLSDTETLRYRDNQSQAVSKGRRVNRKEKQTERRGQS